MDVADSSSSSLSFRELDDVFLQAQARIWIGEVLYKRFDEQISICDLLSDGELLFDVSKALWNMLLVKYMELNNFKASKLIPVDTRKSSGRYRPYSNVDSFLKVCKVLGLSGVDLFSPSDVVEKKDTRKVCICIRSLSKKARSKQVNVPDFDIVTKTVAMPTDVVTCIRRSLELSTSNVTNGQTKHSRLKIRQKSTFVSHIHDNESCVEESDEEKSNYSGTSYADFLYLESVESQDTIDKYALTQESQQADARNQEINEFAHTPGSAESLLLQYDSCDNHLEGISSPICKSRLIVCDEFTPNNHGANLWHINRENALISHKRGEVDHHISLSDTISFRILTDVPFHITEDCLCHSCMYTELPNPDTTPNDSMCRIGRKFFDDVEASPTSSVSSVAGRILDFDACSDADDLRTLASSIPDLQQHRANRLGKLSSSCNHSELEVLDLSKDSFSPSWDDEKSSCSLDQDLESLNQILRAEQDSGDSLVLVKDDVTNIAESTQETLLTSKSLNDKLVGVKMANSDLTYKVDECDQSTQNQAGKGFGSVEKEYGITQIDDVHGYGKGEAEAASKDEIKDDRIDCLVEAITCGENDKRIVKAEKKLTFIAPLLKTVAKSTALFGILFLLHLRNRNDGNTNGLRINKSSQIHWKSSGVGFSRRKGENGSKIYPVEKFKFGD